MTSGKSRKHRESDGDSAPLQGELRRIEPLRIATAGDGSHPIADACEVAVETPVTIDVADVGAYTLMCSPGDTRALAAGFMYTENIIERLGDIAILQQCVDDPTVIRVRLKHPVETDGKKRTLVVSSACGLCGSVAVEQVLASLPAVANSLRVDPGVLRQAVESMREHQTLFARTGGVHGACIFDRTGAVIATAEDIGRHNALDKAIGKCLLRQLPTQGYGVALSGRVSLEMVVKAARAGIELIAAVSAPTSLALDAAERCNLTVCGFVRGLRATVYTAAARVLDQERAR